MRRSAINAPSTGDGFGVRFVHRRLVRRYALLFIALVGLSC